MSLLHHDTQQTPPHSPRCSSRSAMLPAERDPNRAVDALVGAIQNLVSDDNYKVIAGVFREVQDLKVENARLSSSSRDTFEAYRTFRNELEAAEAQLLNEKTELQQSIEQKDSQIQELENEKANLDAEVEEGRRKLSEETQKYSELVEKRDELEKAVTDLEAALDDKSKLLAESDEAKAKLDAELAEAKESLNTKVEELATLESAKTEVDSQLTEARISLDDKTQELASATEAKATIEAQLAEASAKLEDKTKEAEELATAQQALTTELEEANTKLTDKVKELDELSEAKTSLETQLAEVSKTLDDKVRDFDDLSEVKAKLESDLADTSTQLAEKSQEAEGLGTQLTETSTKLDDKTKEAEELTSQLADVNSRLEARTGEIVELSEAKAAVDTKLAEVSESLNAEQEAKKVVEQDLETTKASLQQEADRAGVLSDEVAYLHQTLQDRNEEIDHLKGEVTEGKGNFDHAQLTIRELENITHGLEKELKAKAARLDEIDGYKAKLKDEPEDSCVEILDTIWVSILDLAEKHFSADLDDSVLRDASCWTNLRSSEYLKHAVRIPLPPSNSTAAKQMRIAAVLAVLSRALTKHIFRPSYLVDNDAELSRVLKDLEAVNPAQELHARSTLLAVLPERERRSAARRVKTVVREVSYLVQHLLSALQYEAFCTALEESCELARRQWRRIQHASMKIEPYFGPPYDDFDWQVLLLPENFGSGGRVSPNGGDRISSGSTLGLDAGSSTIGGGARLQDTGAGAGAGDDASTIAESIRSVVDPADIMLVLWPSMCAVENGELVSITQGLVMAKEQASAAFDEEGRRRPWLKDHKKRARSMSQSRKGSSSTAGGGSPRSAKPPFLAHHASRAEGDAGGGGRAASRNGSAVSDERD
ncbi:hypothetical protein VPNG_10307 [Cytospora leucostoma]|uniref:Uncharacterized protein n=1 Tax=Cytospora leucostoma TaxID=1230097 RepID=A0A423VCI7_9PEZI|nr:hypothetical protein VPNG_10307 [Cytospora leucostoma]